MRLVLGSCMIESFMSFIPDHEINPDPQEKRTEQMHMPMLVGMLHVWLSQTCQGINRMY